MRPSRIFVVVGLWSAGLVLCGCGHQANTSIYATEMSDGAKADWAVTLDNIEACSCPTFCQCYFTGQPALHEAAASGQGHAAMRYCRFNNAFRISEGHWGQTDLAGLKFWM